MTRIITYLALLFLVGCQSIPSSRAETVWQTLNAADFSQTMHIARNGCYTEVAWPTAQIIGGHPSESEVALYGAAQALAHYSVTRWLDKKVSSDADDGWETIRTIWHVFTIFSAGYRVQNNYYEGMKPFGGGGPSVPGYDTCGRYW